MYIPANHQLAQSLDSYFGFFFWFFLDNKKTTKIFNNE
jgi:hypothetical protein